MKLDFEQKHNENKIADDMDKIISETIRNNFSTDRMDLAKFQMKIAEEINSDEADIRMFSNKINRMEEFSFSSKNMDNIQMHENADEIEKIECIQGLQSKKWS